MKSRKSISCIYWTSLNSVSAESQLEEARSQLKENSSEDAIAFKIELDNTRQELNSALANVESLKTDKLETDDALSRCSVH